MGLDAFLNHRAADCPYGVARRVNRTRSISSNASTCSNASTSPKTVWLSSWRPSRVPSSLASSLQLFRSCPSYFPDGEHDDRVTTSQRSTSRGLDPVQQRRVRIPPRWKTPKSAPGVSRTGDSTRSVHRGQSSRHQMRAVRCSPTAPLARMAPILRPTNHRPVASVLTEHPDSSSTLRGILRD